MPTSAESRRLTIANGGLFLIINSILFIVMTRISGRTSVVLHSISCCIALLAVAVVSLLFRSGPLKKRAAEAAASASQWFIAPVIWQIAIYMLLDTFGVTQRLYGVRGGKALALATLIALPIWIWTSVVLNRPQEYHARRRLAESLSGFNQRHPRTTYYILYTLLFLLMCLGVFFWFYKTDRTFVWSTDGTKQHFNALIYWGEYLRNFFKSLLFDHTVSLPLWDFSIGMGSDVLTTLHYYVIGDPLTLLSVFVPSAYSEYLYVFLILLRFYLAGLAFSMYCRKMKINRFGSLCGSFVYIFCSFALFGGIRHPYFINPLIYFPILLISIEKIYEGHKPHLFIGMVALSAISNFYFFYMLTIFIFLYALIRFFSIYRERRLYHFGCSLGKFTGYFLVGVLIASLIFIPVVMQVLTTGRMQAEHAIPLLYSDEYYETFLSKWIIAWNVGYWDFLGFAPIAVLAILFLFIQRKFGTELKIALVCGSVFMLFPVFGYILHGFSYISNRWGWALGFVVALTVATMIPRLLSMTRKQGIITGIICLLYLASYLGIKEKTDNQSFFQLQYVILILFFLISLSWLYLRKHKITSFLTKRVVQSVILLLTCVSIVLQGSFLYTSNDNRYLNQFTKVKGATKLLNQNAANDVASINDTSFYRYEEPSTGQSLKNASLGQSFGSTSYYYSIANPSLGKYFNEMYSPYELDYNYDDLDGRTMPLALASVKYLVQKNRPGQTVPYGYYFIKNGADGRRIYQSDNALPFSYTYDSCIRRADYDKLSFIKKQQAMMQSVVVDDNVSMTQSAITYTDFEVPIKVLKYHNLTYKDGQIIATKSNASITLSLSGILNKETYLSLENIHFTGKKKSTEYETPTSSKIIFRYSGNKKECLLASPGYSWYMGKHDYAINLGYMDTNSQEVKITFQRPGVYTFDAIKGICQPMDGLEARVDALKEDTLQNVSFGTNSVTGSINLDQAKLLVLSIPFSDGWKAYVDGQETEILRVNTAYSGLNLDKGRHEIRLTYRTPYLNVGLIACGTGLLIWLGIALYHRRRKN